MIDASRSPRPRWKRLVTLLLLFVFIALAAWLIWVKELHHKDIQVHTVGIPAVVAPATSASSEQLR